MEGYEKRLMAAMHETIPWDEAPAHLLKFYAGRGAPIFRARMRAIFSLTRGQNLRYFSDMLPVKNTDLLLLEANFSVRNLTLEEVLDLGTYFGYEPADASSIFRARDELNAHRHAVCKMAGIRVISPCALQQEQVLIGYGIQDFYLNSRGSRKASATPIEEKGPIWRGDYFAFREEPF